MSLSLYLVAENIFTNHKIIESLPRYMIYELNFTGKYGCVYAIDEKGYDLLMGVMYH